jgi:hypothetical protein
VMLQREIREVDCPKGPMRWELAMMLVPQSDFNAKKKGESFVNSKCRRQVSYTTQKLRDKSIVLMSNQ